MILSIEFDPILETNYHLNSLLPAKKNKAEKTLYNIGGKGIYLGRILNYLNSQVSITGFLGGLSGEYIYGEIEKDKIPSEFIRLKDESRRDIVLLQDEKIITSVTDLGPRITREDLNRFLETYTHIIDGYNIICGVGEVPVGIDEDIYYSLIDIANNRGKRFLLDIKNMGLFYGLDAAPFMVKLDKEELEYLTNIEINHRQEAINLGQGIIESGVEILLVDLGESGSIVLTRDKAYNLQVLDSNIIALSEDKGFTIAGYAFAMDKGYDFETTMKIGQSFRIAYALNDLDKVDMSDIKRIMSNIEIIASNY